MGASCTLCSGEAVFRREYEGSNLCERCFRISLEERVRRTIVKHHMLEYDDHIALALSGGKDSLALLHVLAKLEKRFPRSRITAISIDEGIEGYRDEALQLARNACEKLRVNHMVVSYRELFNVTTDEIVKRDLDRGACSYCGVFRRKAINRAARLIGATKIATAHNLDDEAQTILLNMLHGDPIRLVRSSPVLRDPRGKFLTRIKPFYSIPEREIALYAYLSSIEFQSIPCPHSHEAFRNELRDFLNMAEAKHPESKFTIQKTVEKLRSMLESALPISELKECGRCGDPTTSSICEGCLMMDEIAA